MQPSELLVSSGDGLHHCAIYLHLSDFIIYNTLFYIIIVILHMISISSVSSGKPRNSEYLEMDVELRTISYSSAYRAYRSTATVRCREDRLMLHSYGDTELVCGLDPTGTVGAWRSLRGMLAITKHRELDM